MELIFLENDGKWIAEFKVDKEFNLHIEREDGTGKIKMYQNSATGGKYAIVEDFAINNNYKPVLDFSSGYFVGEKTIKIVSDVEPTYAAITTEGDVVEIKAQAKVVEISSNGTTSVEPDAGFSYLSKVDVKVDVPTSGEGGGDAGGGFAMEYFDLSDDNTAQYPILATVALYVTKGKFLSPSGEDVSITDFNVATYVLMQMGNFKVIAGGLDFNSIILSKKNGVVVKETLLESILKTMAQGGFTMEDLNAAPRITKEEFYTL